MKLEITVKLDEAQEKRLAKYLRDATKAKDNKKAALKPNVER